MKNLLKSIRLSGIEVIEVANSLKNEELSKLIRREFNLDPVFASDLRYPLGVEKPNPTNGLVLSPKLVILKPLSIIVTSRDCHLEALNHFNNYIFYISDSYFSESLEYLHDSIMHSYNEDIRFGITKISLTNELLAGKSRRIKVVFNSNISGTSTEGTRTLLV